MVAVVTVLLAFPLGFFVRSRLAASTAYAIAYLWAFVFQTLYLTLDSLGGGENPAFEPGEFPLDYGIVTLAIFGVGFGLVNLGHWLKARSSRTGTSASATNGKTAASANVSA
jgi:hypothetical protein